MNVLNVRALEREIAEAVGETGLELVPVRQSGIDVVTALAEALAGRGVLMPSSLTDDQALAALRENVRVEGDGRVGGWRFHGLRVHLGRLAKGEIT